MVVKLRSRWNSVFSLYFFFINNHSQIIFPVSNFFPYKAKFIVFSLSGKSKNQIPCYTLCKFSFSVDDTAFSTQIRCRVAENNGITGHIVQHSKSQPANFVDSQQTDFRMSNLIRTNLSVNDRRPTLSLHKHSSITKLEDNSSVNSICEQEDHSEH